MYCDRSLSALLKYTAGKIEIPMYSLAEHCIQIGLAEVWTTRKDEALMDSMYRHLVQDHLLTPVTKPESEPLPQRVLQLQNALDFLGLLEIWATPAEQREIIRKLWEDSRTIGGNNK